MDCLICQKEMLYLITVKTLVWGKYTPSVLCRECLNQPKCLEICHQHFLLERDYRYYLTFSDYYKQTFKRYKRHTVITHPPFYQQTLLADYTYKIVARHLKNVVSVLTLNHPLNAPVLLVDYNGVAAEYFEKLTKQTANIERLTLWRQEYGNI